MATVSGDNLQNFCLLILVSWRQAFTRIVIGNSLQKLDRCGLGAPWVRSALSPSLSLFGNAGLSSKGFMLAIDTAGTYPEIQLLYTGSMTPGEICYKVYWLATIDWSLHCWFSRESPISLKETHPYDIYHEGDITLVTLESVLACFSVSKRSCFSLSGRVLFILDGGVRPHGRW